MKDYHEMAESVFRRRDRYAAERKKQMKRQAAALSCFCLCAIAAIGAWRSGVFSTERPAQTLPVGSEPGAASAESGPGVVQQPPVSQAVPSASEGGNNDSAGSTDNDKLIVADGTPLAPQVTYLTEAELFAAAGGLLPDKAPDGFAFDSAILSEHGYSVIWYRGLEELNWRIRDYREEDAQRITSVADTENYDLSLYPIPRADSVPDELREIVDNPIFRIEDLTRDALYARAYKVNDAGDSDGYRMHFSVLCADQLISITSKGISPDWLYDQLSKLPH